VADVRIQPESFATRGIRGRVESLALRFPAVVASTGISMLAAIFVAIMFFMLHGRAPLAVGQLAPESRVVRVPLEIEDELATDAYRQAAREQAPRVYLLDPRVLPEMIVFLENLPRAAAEASNSGVAAGKLRDLFTLSDPALAALRPYSSGILEAQWQDRISVLGDLLLRTPLVDTATFQVEALSPNGQVELRIPQDAASIAQRQTGAGASTVLSQLTGPPGIATRLPTRRVLAVGSDAAARTLREHAMTAGLDGLILEVVLSRLTRSLAPTYVFDTAATSAAQDAAAEAVSSKLVTKAVGQVIYAEGDRITPEQIRLATLERAAYEKSQLSYQRLVAVLAPAGSGLLIVAAMVAFVRTYASALLLTPGRFATYFSIIIACMTVAVVVATREPWLLPASIAGAAALAAMVSSAMYDRRLAFGIGTLVALGLCTAMKLPVSLLAMSLVGVGFIAWLLRELRQRNTLIKTALVAAGGAGAAAFLFGLLDRPLARPALDQSVWEAGTVAAAVLLAGFLVLGVLPWLERALGVTTGLTLLDLRDPQHPLLRSMQQRAPGTYNHSLNVATLAEAAADSIGADSLLAYVGSLYHDVGKMNKPDYFVENQSGGINRHDRLTPAMSLLVIVSHVRDGIELAREHKLPISLHHFIEAHHGTTLVEYFFHRAKRQAEAAGDDGTTPLEVEYRYPGPKPRTKEVALMMVCDATESATRSLSDVSAAKIESLVRAIAHKRLMDGQFDECELTLGELHTAVEAISRTLVSMNHQRIAYPDGAPRMPQPARPALAAAL